MDHRSDVGGAPRPERPVIGPPPPRQPPGAVSTPRPAPPAPAGPPPAGAPGGRRRGRVLVALAVLLVLAVGAVVAVAVLRGGGSSFEPVVLGTSAGPASEPTEEVWSVPLAEEGLTTVIGGEDVVLVTEDAVHVTALDAGDGRELWTAELDGGDFNRAVPLQGGAVLLETEPESDEPRTRLVDARTGEERWEAEGEIPTIYRDHTSTDASSIHDLDVVVLLGDDGVVGVDRETGEERWEAEGTADAGACGGVVVATTDGVGEGYSAVAVDPATGDEMWSADGRVGPCRDGQVALADGATITVREAADGSVVDEVELDDDPGQLIATPLDDEHLLVQGASQDTGETFATIRSRTDGEVVYERTGVLGSPLGEGTLYLTPTDGDAGGTFVRIEDGEELATTELDQSRSNDCFTAYAVDQIVVCSSLGTEVVGHAIDDGSERWAIDSAEGEVHAVGVVGDRLVVATADRVVAYTA
jgi:outer membrane protein assembly factor BamB